jgi:hypothetical protein
MDQAVTRRSIRFMLQVLRDAVGPALIKTQAVQRARA